MIRHITTGLLFLGIVGAVFAQDLPPLQELSPKGELRNVGRMTVDPSPASEVGHWQAHKSVGPAATPFPTPTPIPEWKPPAPPAPVKGEWNWGTWTGTRLDRAGAINSGAEVDYHKPGAFSSIVRPTALFGWDQVAAGGMAGKIFAGLSCDIRKDLPAENRRLSFVFAFRTTRW